LLFIILGYIHSLSLFVHYICSYNNFIHKTARTRKLHRRTTCDGVKPHILAARVCHLERPFAKTGNGM